MGLGILRAELFSVNPWFLTVWDEAPGKTGGTADSVKYFPWPGQHFNILPPGNGKPAVESPPAVPLMPAVNPVHHREMKFILFSDISGFSRLDEEKTPLFILKFLTAVSEKLNIFKPAPVILNTWGDAIFAVMNNVADLAEYAFILQQAVLDTDWSLAGLPQLNIRIALHAGPVFLADDPLLKVVNAYGTHINRAARMEPVTAPGSIYVSEQFAAALLLERRGDYRFEHAGIIELPKKFGKQEMFRLVRSPKADHGLGI
jgi:class 3 adenylate cyclase